MYEIYWAKGDYYNRQQAANREGCVAYLEAHYNALAKDAPGTQDNPSLVIVGANASQTSKNWGTWFSAAVAAEFGIDDRGLLIGPKRGDYNLRYTAMPAILIEPLFCSDATHAELIKSDAGMNRLARIVVESVRRFFPSGGKLGFSVGHKYKTKNPHDRGAPIKGGGWEADFAEEMLKRAAGMLTNAVDVTGDKRVLTIVRNGRMYDEIELDADDVVGWNPCTETVSVG